MTRASELGLIARIDEIFGQRDREHMQPTIDAFEGLLREHPDDPRVLYEVGGSYDTDGQEARAVDYYERALDIGLDGNLRRRCLLQYGSTLRNLGRLEESRDVLDRGCAEFPDSTSLRVFRALTAHAAEDINSSVGDLLLVIADHLDDPEIERYRAAIRANGEYVMSLAGRQ